MRSLEANLIKYKPLICSALTNFQANAEGAETFVIGHCMACNPRMQASISSANM